ncbi:hypothetical protein F5882DRAFT_95662 [Hyaloscypha sp. PMI_1271]|nr:hypothetical protein F5882DRAFT_95662 [Hyaloscypha sp. PMI_1271]
MEVTAMVLAYLAVERALQADCVGGGQKCCTTSCGCRIRWEPELHFSSALRSNSRYSPAQHASYHIKLHLREHNFCFEVATSMSMFVKLPCCTFLEPVNFSRCYASVIWVQGDSSLPP